jgi:multiple sugar transport system ATP-binding protein
MVFQNYALYPHMTVYDNMAFGLRRRKLPPAEVDRKVRGAADTLGLEPYLLRKPRELSGGERQRVALGRAMVREPQVFLFDEPLSNLDAKLRVQMRAEIKRLHQRVNATMIYVTHDQVEAMTLATRIAVMNDGRFSQISTPDELYARPANTFVANFIGSPAMNFVPGRIVLGDSKVRIRTVDGIDFDVSTYAFAARPADGMSVTLGLRPELFHLPAQGAVFYKTRLNIIEPLGANVLCYCSLGKTEVVASLNPTDVAGAKSDEELPLSIDFSKISIFDAASSLRL